MERIEIKPRENWSNQIEALGYDFYKYEGVKFWEEGAYYKFTPAEVDTIEAAAKKLHALCLLAVEHIIRQKLFPLLGLDEYAARLVVESWERKDPHVYGRFDLVYDGVHPPKMLEYNADTPTALFEASIIQWDWREKTFPRMDQFNWIHEALIARWKALRVGRRDRDMLYVTCATPMPEDETTTQYIGECARQAGWQTKFLPIQDVGWHEGRQQFTDLGEKNIVNLFKLYPWEWILKESFGLNVRRSATHFIEPPWKALLSNKVLLPILWEMFPEHENLLPAYRDPALLEGQRVVRKACLGREGSNIKITDGNSVLAQTDGIYADSGYVYQAYCEPPDFNGFHSTIGAWVVGNDPCGMIVREDKELIISNFSHICPHVF